MSLNISQAFRKDGADVSVNMHNLKRVVADSSGTSAWVSFIDDLRQPVTFYVDHELAHCLADAFDDYENWLSSQEGPTFDDALGAKCDAAAAVEAARALK